MEQVANERKDAATDLSADASTVAATGVATKRVVISGYYGFGNSGDEAVLHAILRALREEGEEQGIAIEPVVLSINPKMTERVHQVKAVHRLNMARIIQCIRRSDALISGGGSMLQDTTGLSTIPYYLGIIKLAQLLGKPTFIYSQGLGPIRHRAYYPLIRHTFNRSAYISVRDAESVQLLEQIGVRPQQAIEIVSDPVMGLPLESYVGAAGDEAMDGTASDGQADERVSGGARGQAGEGTDEKAEGLAGEGGQGQGQGAASGASPIIGISVRLWHPQRQDLDAIAQALRLILEQRDVHLRFLPFYPPYDVEASEHIIAQLSASYKERMSIADTSPFPQHMLREVSGCDLVIGMRLHSLIYAASYHIPMVGISYDPKIDHFLQRMEMQSSGSTDQLDPETIATETWRLLTERADWVQSKQHLIEAMKNKSHQPAKQICEFLRLNQ